MTTSPRLHTSVTLSRERAVRRGPLYLEEGRDVIVLWQDCRRATSASTRATGDHEEMLAQSHAYSAADLGQLVSLKSYGGYSDDRVSVKQ
jgi:hypothetical protein